MKSVWLLWLGAIFVFNGIFGFGQSNPNTDQGLKPYDSLHGGALDSVSMTSGNLFFHKQLYALPQRGRTALSFSLQYNNKGFRLFSSCTTKTNCKYTWLWSGNGVQLVNDQNLGVSSKRVDTGQTNGQGSEVFANIYSAITSDDATHPLADTGNGYRSIDGSGILWDGSSLSARDRSGMYVGSLGSSSLDPNGNTISTDITAHTWTDTLGRVAPWLPLPPSTSTASLSSCPNLNLTYQPVTYAYQWNVPGPTGTSQFILCYASVFVRTAFWGSSYTNTNTLQDVNQAVAMLQSVVQPDGTAWTFTYDGANPNDTTSLGYGDLLKIGFPTGGSLSYTYATEVGYQGYYQPDMLTTQSRSVVTRTVDANDGAGGHSWSYNWGGPTVATSTAYTVENTVTDAQGNDTVHVISGLLGGPSLYETQSRYYQGSKSSGTLLKKVNTDYSYSSNPFDNLGANVNPPTAINVMPIRVTTIWPSGQTSKEESDYDSAFTFRDPTWGLPIQPPLPQQSATYSGTLGTVSARREYDYGSGGAAGNLLKETFSTYLWQSNSNYLSANLLDLSAQVTVCSLLADSESADASGCSDTNFTLKRRSQSVFGYDDPARLSAANIGTQHGAASGPVRGNPTSVAQWLSGSGCNPQTAGSCPTSYTNWLDTGEVYQSIDPLNHTTTHSYDAYYAGAYSTQTCNALNQCISGTYDFNTGLLTSFTDANATAQASGNTSGDAAHTSQYAYDNMLRMTSAILPADAAGQSPETDFSYPNATAVQRMKKQTGSSSIKDYAYFDGLGRTKQTQLVDQEGDDFVDTTYDALGRVSTVSNPHRSAASTTDGITTNYYDALGRLVQIAGSDGTLVSVGTAVTQCQSNNVCTDYSNFPTVTVTDQAGKVRRSRTNALGQLVEVDEPGPGPNSTGTSGSGSISISGSLYSTTSSGTKATGWFSVSGSDDFVLNCGPGGLCNPKFTSKTWDWGDVQITINGTQASVQYGQSSTAAALATSLAGKLSPHPITFSDSGTGTITMTADAPGPNYSLSGVAFSNDPTDFGAASFSVAVSGASLTGGVYPVTSYDSGTVTVTVGSFQASAPYSQSGNSTAAQVASALVSSTNPNGLNRSGSPVTATASGATISMTATGVGTSTNYSVTGSSTISFTASSSTLSGGTNPGGLYASWVTQYSYDTLGNLTQVNQQGDGSQAARVRSFTYDSLSRLLTATNPESGKISYGYDANGNVLQKTSPAPNQTGTGTQTISYCYDKLNRLTGKAYSSQSCPISSPAMTYIYDSGANGIGHLTSLTDQAGSGSYSYDALGRITGELRTINGVQKSLSYVYNLDNSISQLIYPSTAVLTYSYTNAGHAGAVQDTSNNISYISGTGGMPALATHAPDGSLAGYVNGFTGTFGGIGNSVQYNSRLQVCRITALNGGTLPSSCTDNVHLGNVLDLGYNLNLGSGNNGNVVGITNYRDTSRSQTFTYDQLNRLTSARNAGSDCTRKTANNGFAYWGNTYTYDAWGNLTNKTVMQNVNPPTCSGENLNAPVNTNNQLVGYGYDAAGNMTHDATTGNNYSYDPENRITGAAGYTYTYDADGNRIEKSNGSTGTIYWYMSSGIVAESDLSGNLTSEYVFFNGERMARKDFPSGSVSYYFSDELKTASVITNSAGTITEDEDFYPWGGELPFLNSDSNHYKFGGHERDNETGLDYMLARYYSNPLGRFLTPDWAAKPITVPYANFGNPQSLNLYTYSKNNPTTFGDPDGHDPLLGPGIDVSSAVILTGLKSFWHWVTSGSPPQVSAPQPPHSSVPDPFPPGSCVCPPSTNQNNDSKQNNNNSYQQNAKADQLKANAEKGAASEQKVLNEKGLTKNTQKVTGSEGKSIPDALTNTESTEIKDAARVVDSKQLRVQQEAAQNSNRTNTLVTGANTKVSPTAERRFDKVERRPDLGPQN